MSDSSIIDLFTGAPWDAYTRADALREGVLIDATRRASALGFNVPVALTREVWEDCVRWDAQIEAAKPERTNQSPEGRLHDVLWLAFLAAATTRDGHRQWITFDVFRVPPTGEGLAPSRVTLVLTIGPGDTVDPVITISLPSLPTED